MKNKTILSLLFYALPAFFPAYAAGFSLDDLVGPDQARSLIAGDKPVQAQFGDVEAKLVPQNDVLKGLIEKVRQDLGPSVMVETLQLYQKPPEAEKTAWSTREETELYNGVLALSTLEGLQYYSQSHGSMRTFYVTSSVIDGPSTKKPLPDPVYPFVLTELSIYARQKDLSFGDNIYQYDFSTTPGAMIFVQQNLTALTVGIIPAVGKNKLRTVVAIMDAGDYLLVYAGSMAKAASLPGMKERIGASFANRIEAVVHWFSGQADQAFQRAHQ